MSLTLEVHTFFRVLFMKSIKLCTREAQGVKAEYVKLLIIERLLDIHLHVAARQACTGPTYRAEQHTQRAGAPQGCLSAPGLHLHQCCVPSTRQAKQGLPQTRNCS